MRNTRMLSLLICLFAAIMLAACSASAAKTPDTEAAQTVSGDPVNAEPSAQGETNEPAPSAVETSVPQNTDDESTVWVYGQAVTVGSFELVILDPVADLSELSESLPKLPTLKSVQLTRDCAEWKSLSVFEEEWAALKESYPAIRFTDRLLIHGEPAASVTSYSVPGWMGVKSEVKAVLRCCSAIRTIDLTDADVSREMITEFAFQNDGKAFLWTDPAFGTSSSDAKTLELSGAHSPEEIAEYLGCFPKLSEVDLTKAQITEEETDALTEQFPNAEFRRMIDLNGTQTDSYSKELDLSGAVIGDKKTFSDQLAKLTRLEKVELHFCSLSDEEIAEIRDRYPNVRFVWTVTVGQFRVRTDAVAFSTEQSETAVERLTAEDVQALRYCRDLIALDLSHNDIRDLEWLSELQNLQVLSLADNRELTDASVVGTLAKLKYLELYKTGVEDISPLANLSELLDVNLFYLRVTDITPLLSCTKLERIWIGEMLAARIGEGGVDTLKKAFPDAKFDFVSVNPRKRGWNEHPRYLAIRSMYETGEAKEPFLP